MKVFLKHSMDDFRRSYKKILLFEAIYLVMTSLFFVPAIAFIFTRMLRAMGTNLLLNGDVYRMALSYQGMAGFAIIAFVSGLILFMDFGTVLVLVQKRLFGKDVLLSDAFVTAVRAIPRLLGLGFVQLLLLFLICIPFVDSPLTGHLLGGFNFPIFVVSHLYNSRLLFALYAAAVLGAVYLFLRWIFALHFILIEGQRTAEAMRSSFRLTRTRKGNLLVHLLLLNVTMYGTVFGLLSLLSYLLASADSPFFKFVITDLYAPFSAFVTYVFTMLVIPVNLILLTRLYYVFRKAKGNRLEDRLTLARSKVLRHVEVRIAGYFRSRGIRRILLLFAIVYVSGVMTLQQSIGHRFVYLDWNVKIAAHRGDIQQAPENSISSIRSALAKQVDAVEIDVQMSKDGVIVLNHDYTFERVAGLRASAHELTLAEMLTLDIRGAWTGMPVERVPTLIEAMREVKGKAKLIIEIKPYGQKEELARKVAELVTAEEMAGECYVQSFDYSVLQTVRRANPDIPVGQILFAAAGNVSSLDVDFYTISQNMLSKRFIQRAHRLDREVWVWTVNIERNMREVLTYDVDGIITDYPDRLQMLVGVE
jgi:glycerophosphoryl diester phosphodiesterase